MGNRWIDIHDKKSKRFTSIVSDFGPVATQVAGWLAFTVVGLMMTLSIFGSDVGGWVFFGMLAANVFVAGALSQILYKILYVDEEELVETGALTSTRSYAFMALEAELSQLSIHIRHMNDKHDHSVGIVPIRQYLQVTLEPTRLIDAGWLDSDTLTQAKSAVDGLAREFAAQIRFNFDQRELARQAIEKGDLKEAERLQQELDGRLKATHSARAELWLANYRAGVIG